MHRVRDLKIQKKIHTTTYAAVNRLRRIQDEELSEWRVSRFGESRPLQMPNAVAQDGTLQTPSTESKMSSNIL